MILEKQRVVAKQKKKYRYPPKPDEMRFVVRLPKEDYATLSLLSHIEDDSLNGTIIMLIRREMVRKKQA